MAASLHKDDQLSLKQVDKIMEILNGNILLYSRKRIENMLRAPEGISLDEEGRMCIVYIHNSARVMQREIWMVFATPVAMAVFLKKYTYVSRLIEAGYKYDVLSYFEAYNIEGNIGEHNHYSCISRCTASQYNICRFNRMTNYELMTCMKETPEHICSGAWNELVELNSSKVVLDSVPSNMELYYLYCDALACESLRNDNDTAVSSKLLDRDSREGIEEYCEGCIQRYSVQLNKIYANWG